MVLLVGDADNVPRCDCPDATFRERPTAREHAQAVTAACEQLDLVI